MRFADLMRFALGALTHHKVRTLLTVLGVLLGSLTLVLSLSVGLGVQATALREFQRHGELLEIEVWPARGDAAAEVPAEALRLKGSMSPDKQERIRAALRHKWQQQHVPSEKKSLDRNEVAQLAQLDHVVKVVPSVNLFGRAYLADRPGEEVHGYAAGQDDERLRGRLVAGDYFSSENAHEVLVHEFLLYEWDVADDDQVRALLGQRLRLRLPIYRQRAGSPLFVSKGDPETWTPAENEALRQGLERLPGNLDRLDLPGPQRDALKKALSGLRLGTGDEPAGDREFVEELTVRGVFRAADEKEPRRRFDYGRGDGDLVVPLGTGADALLRMQGNTATGFDHVVVTVDSEENVKAVNQAIAARGLQSFSWSEALDQVRMTILLITFATGFIAVIALLVAAIGIANVMLMSVLERTREIGVMKAVGAQERHIQLIFLIEGAVLGLLGGGLGLLAGWLASVPGNAVAASLISERMKEPFHGSVFIFPPWLLGSVLAFTVLVTTLAALYPARRASRINPITALRTE